MSRPSNSTGTNQRILGIAFAATPLKRYRQAHSGTPCPLMAPSAAPEGHPDQNSKALHAHDQFDTGTLQLMIDRAATSPTVATIMHRYDRNHPARSCAGPVVSSPRS